MSREFLDCLKRERDISIKPILSGVKTAFRFTPALSERSREQLRKASKQSIFLARIDIFQRYPVSMISSTWYRYPLTLKNTQLKTVLSVGTVSGTDLTSFFIYAFLHDLLPAASTTSFLFAGGSYVFYLSFEYQQMFSVVAGL